MMNFLQCLPCAGTVYAGFIRMAQECQHFTGAGGRMLCTPCAVLQDRCQGCGMGLNCGRDEKILEKVRRALALRDKKFAAATKVYYKSVSKFRDKADAYDANTDAALDAYAEANRPYETAFNNFYKDVPENASQALIKSMFEERMAKWNIVKEAAGTVKEKWDEQSLKALEPHVEAYNEAKRVLFAAKSIANQALDKAMDSVVASIQKLVIIERERRMQEECAKGFRPAQPNP